MPARHVLVGGSVQGVGFRWSARSEAERLGVAGWVRNLPDGRVETHLEGAADAVDAMVGWLRMGPPGSRVESVEVRDAGEEGLAGFDLRR